MKFLTKKNILILISLKCFFPQLLASDASELEIEQPKVNKFMLRKKSPEKILKIFNSYIDSLRGSEDRLGNRAYLLIEAILKKAMQKNTSVIDFSKFIDVIKNRIISIEENPFFSKSLNGFLESKIRSGIQKIITSPNKQITNFMEKLEEIILFATINREPTGLTVYRECRNIMLKFISLYTICDLEDPVNKKQIEAFGMIIRSILPETITGEEDPLYPILIKLQQTNQNIIEKVINVGDTPLLTTLGSLNSRIDFLLGDVNNLPSSSPSIIFFSPISVNTNE